ncbi:unnamed protein product [Heligmosomoides polygyrus]|uniref:Reverse transcriptase domain-containing protein n=1 Tax=Heligmosomoides polygyrus TaxID=6339 RepID=A0A3P8IYF5_HELPZ|nr:unnamed protein product [Heligmosomoides polygyrus]
MGKNRKDWTRTLCTKFDPAIKIVFVVESAKKVIFGDFNAKIGPQRSPEELYTRGLQWNEQGFSTIDHIHTITKLIEVSREYKLPLCLTFIDLKKAFDSVETEAVIDALLTQGVPTHKGGQ